MVKKRRFVIYLIAGIAIGFLSALLCLSLLKYRENNARYKACLVRDFHGFDLNKANYVLSDNNTGATTFYFDNVRIIKSGDSESTLFFDSWSGQIREYHKGVLVTVSVGEYEEIGIGYKQYQIHTIEECEAIRQEVNEVDVQDINPDYGYKLWESVSGKVYKLWKTVSGEVFIDCIDSYL